MIIPSDFQPLTNGLTFGPGAFFMFSPKKLSLRKDTVRALAGTEMQAVVGGAYYLAMAATGHCGICTKSCATCGCPKRDYGNVILPAFNQLRAF